MTVVDEALLARISRERKFDPKTLEIARRLFIEDAAPKKLAAEYGVIFQRIYAIRRAVLDAVADYALPSGWSEVTLRGPAEAIAAAEKAYRQYMAKL
jgi:hypothetical protein